MSFKSTFLSFALLLASATAFAGTEVMPVDLPVIAEACTLSATFSTGGTSVDVTVTADSCGGAAATLTAVGDALDQM